MPRNYSAATHQAVSVAVDDLLLSVQKAAAFQRCTEAAEKTAPRCGSAAPIHQQMPVWRAGRLFVSAPCCLILQHAHKPWPEQALCGAHATKAAMPCFFSWLNQPGVTTKTSGSSPWSSRMVRTRSCHSRLNSATSCGAAVLLIHRDISMGRRGEAGTR